MMNLLDMSDIEEDGITLMLEKPHNMITLEGEGE